MAYRESSDKTTVPSRARDYFIYRSPDNVGADPAATLGIPQSGSNISHPAISQLRTLRCPNFTPCDVPTSHPAMSQLRTLRSSRFAPCDVLTSHPAKFRSRTLRSSQGAWGLQPIGLRAPPKGIERTAISAGIRVPLTSPTCWRRCKSLYQSDGLYSMGNKAQ